MDRSSSYFRQVQLLLQTLPFVSRESCFALKGGTAINLFVRDFPRLSVDIDLVYLPLNNRETALAESRAALGRIADALTGAFPEVDVQRSFEQSNDALRLVVSTGEAVIKVELSPVLRGTVLEPSLESVEIAVEEEFGFAETTVVALMVTGRGVDQLARFHIQFPSTLPARRLRAYSGGQAGQAGTHSRRFFLPRAISVSRASSLGSQNCLKRSSQASTSCSGAVSTA